VPPEAVIQTLDTLLHHRMSLRALQLYVSSFFDVDSVGRAQLRLLVQGHVRLAVVCAVPGTDDDALVRRAISNDARVVAVSLPHSGSAWAAVSLSLGIMPPKRQLSAVVEELTRLAGARAGQALARGGRDDERRAESYVDVMQRLVEIQDSVRSPSDSLAQTLLSRIKLTQDDKPLITMDALVAQGDEVAPLEMGPPKEGQVTRTGPTPAADVDLHRIRTQL
jgi:hypothetical protein